MLSHEDERLGCKEPTPCPYQTGQRLRIQVLQSFQTPPIPYEADAIISKVFSMTMSPVMAVTIMVGPVSHGHVVLKLYDRRFGTHFRKVNGEFSPHTASDEAAFQSLILNGKFEPFLHELAAEKKDSMIPPRPEDWLEDDSPDAVARFEAALWQESQEHFKCEADAYRRLSDLQGQVIPNMYAHVRLVPESSKTASAATQSQLVPYLEVKGMLLERIYGYDLWDLPISSLAPQERAWPGIVQSAVDAAYTINKRGVLMKDCDPRNVLVDQNSHTPFIIDLAQCLFKDEVIKFWEEEGLAEDDEWNEGQNCDLEAEWRDRLRQTDNCGAIGSVMATRLRREKNMDLIVKYPDYEKMIMDLRQRKISGGKAELT